MAELADAADSKSAGLRPLGVRPPLPAPSLKPASEAGFSDIDHSKIQATRMIREWSCDAPVTGIRRIPA